MEISAETFTQIIAALRSDKRGPNEKRVHPRVGLSGKALLQNDDGSITPVSVRDLSQSGVGLIRTSAWKVGQRFTLCFPSTANVEEYKGIICEVVRTNRVADGVFTMGAKFIEHIKVPRSRESSRSKTRDDSGNASKVQSASRSRRR